MSDVPLADTCVCGVDSWHRPVRSAQEHAVASGSSSSLLAVRALWCRKCGSVRFMFDSHWQIPLDRAGEIARSILLDDAEVPTNPGTPEAKNPSKPGLKRDD